MNCIVLKDVSDVDWTGVRARKRATKRCRTCMDLLTGLPDSQRLKNAVNKVQTRRQILLLQLFIALKAGLQTFLGFFYVHTITIAIHGRRLASEIAY